MIGHSGRPRVQRKIERPPPTTVMVELGQSRVNPSGTGGRVCVVEGVGATSVFVRDTVTGRTREVATIYVERWAVA